RGRRAEFRDFGWDPADVPDPQDRSTFERSRLRWDELAQPEHTAMLELHRRLLRLRRETAGFDTGDRELVRTATDPATGLLRYAYCGLELACNLGDGPLHVQAPPGADLVAGDPLPGDAGVTTLQPDSMVVWRLPGGG
ncbi:MAG: DUF3459 domain-containing protein, partial [Candidatus Dormibacteraeota bacterium]|nr:DUF3459 domain-containing protein [Candidatus Dormibacteraeota bacterium]